MPKTPAPTSAATKRATQADADLRATPKKCQCPRHPLPLPLDYEAKEQGQGGTPHFCSSWCKPTVRPTWPKCCPYRPDAWIDHSKIKVGYEIPFNRHFYEYEPPRPLADIEADILALEKDIIMAMLQDVTA